MIKVITRQLICTAMIIICSQFVFGQNANKYTLPQITPLAPNAATFAKYGEIPVSLSSGIPNISVPLFSIKAGSIEVPISLSYHNNGLKVDEIPSYVGLGWNLNATGVINYEQRGNDDFDVDGKGMFTHTTYNSKDSLKLYLNNTMNATRKFNYLERVMAGDMDAQYDLYHFNFLGYSGSFYFDSSQHIVCVPKSNLKIIKDNDYFDIIDEKGNTFYFWQAEHNASGPLSGDENEDRKAFSHNASFYLTKISTAEGRVINFTYTNYAYSYYTQHDYVNQFGYHNFSQCPYSNLATGYSQSDFDNYMLTGISFPEGSVAFELSSDYRVDLKHILHPIGAINVPYLKKITLRDSASNVISEFKLHYYNGTRLQLLDLVKDSSSTNAEKWKFDYIGDTSFPAFFTHTKDHWGYYNGSYSSTGLPAADYSKLVQQWHYEITYPADRESNFDYASRGMLSKITYPTGGTTSFEYESNRIVFTDFSQITNMPFLSVSGVSSHTEPVVSLDTDIGGSTEGSFTLDEPAYVYISASKLYDPYSFIYSDIYLANSPGFNYSTNWFYSYPYIPFSCNAYSQCYADDEGTLSAGTYYFGLFKNMDSTDNPYDGRATLGISKVVNDSNFRQPYHVGGGRVIAVTSVDSLGHSIKKKYVYADRIDSLTFRNVPYYISTSNINKNGDYIMCGECGKEYKIHDESVFPLVGNPVDYAYITEYTDNDGANGKTVYTYTTAGSLSEEGTQPYVTPFISTWRGGLLADKKVYAKNGSSYTLVSRDTTLYENTYPYDSVIKGVKAAYWTYCDQDDPYYREIATTKENYQTEKFYPKSNGQVLYDNAGNIKTGSTSLYASTKHIQPTQTEMINSKGDTLRTKIKYSADYDTSSITNADAQGIRLLQRKNILAPIENLTVKTIGGTQYVIGGTITTYKNDIAVPAKVYQLKLSSPVLLSSFTTSAITSGNFSKDSHYEERAAFDSFDVYHNVLQEHYSNNIYKSYIWDYKSTYPVAEVTNASVGAVARTSFESDGKGNWSYSGTGSSDASSPTGSQCYNLGSGNITKSGLTSTTYVISYWSKSGSYYSVNSTSPARTGKTIDGWTYYEHEVTGTSITISGTGYIDEVRLYPKGALMTSYTFQPLVGMTSQCDANNHIIYYQYDDNNRLKIIKDEDKKVLKKLEYKFKATPQ